MTGCGFWGKDIEDMLASVLLSDVSLGSQLLCRKNRWGDKQPRWGDTAAPCVQQAPAGQPHEPATLKQIPQAPSSLQMTAPPPGGPLSQSSPAPADPQLLRHGNWEVISDSRCFSLLSLGVIDGSAKID